MSPLWKQRQTEQAVNLKKRARSVHERRRVAAQLGLSESDFNFEALRPPWQISSAQSPDKNPEDMTEDEWQEFEELRALGTSRFFTVDIQRLQALGCPANSRPGLKARYFDRQISALSIFSTRSPSA